MEITFQAIEYRETLKKILVREPANFIAHNKLGTELFISKEFSEAISHFREALKFNSHYFDAEYNLCLALTQHGMIQDAVTHWENFLKRYPEQNGARFHLGCCLMYQKKFSAAEKIFKIILKKHPTHSESIHNLATCFLEQNAFREAFKYYQIVNKINPTDETVLFNLGIIADRLQDKNAAIRYYQQALHLAPDYFAAHYNVAVLFMMEKHNEFAMDHLKAAQKLKPNDQHIRYLIQILKPQQNVTGAPKEYITALFNHYADHYEQHLIYALEYTLPNMLFKTAKKICAFKKSVFLTLLDIGCGTGLCAELFSPFCQSMDGVDLSENMLAIARKKNIFRSLFHGDCISFLTENKITYDIILAGDVLVYFGKLIHLFESIKNALNLNGFFIFNTEISEEKDFTMLQSGRFAHNKKYLIRLAEQFCFKINYLEKINSRTQNNIPVPSYLVILQKS